MQLKSLYLLMCIFTLVCCAPITQKAEKDDMLYAPMAASLCFINQKVEGHFLVSGIPDNFNEAQYKTAVQDVCYPIPTCKAQAQDIFDNYGIRARKIDDMFSIMLCDKEMKNKIMEDFSCNNTRVEIRSWKSVDPVPCSFEDRWDLIKQEHCNN